MPGANNDKTDDKNKNGKAGDEGTGAGDEGEKDPSNAAAGSEGDGGDDAGDFADPAKALAEIKKLRAENAKHRTKNKSLEEKLGSIDGTMKKLKSALGVEDESEDPEQKLKTLQAQNEAMQMQMAMSDLCREHEIPRKGEKYFNFLIAQEFESLKEGEEISEDRILEISKETKAMFSSGGASSTGVDTSKKPNPGEKPDSLSAAQFAKMNPGEKSALYVKDPNQYNKLFQEAREKRLF